VNGPAFVARLVDRLVFGLVHAQLYGPEHARVREAAADAARALGEYATEAGTSSVVLGAVGDRVVFEGRPVLGATLFAKRLLVRLRERGAGGLEFLPCAAPSDLAGLLGALARRGDVPGDVTDANRDLHARAVVGVRFLPPYAGEAGAAAGEDGPPADTRVVAIHQATVDLLQEVTIGVCQGRDLDLAHVGSVVEGMAAGLARQAGWLHSLAHYPDHDFFTFGHSIRVALLALDVARATGADPALLQRIGVAALLHDVGKALVPWEVLHKRGPLDADERQVMQRHPVLGAGVLLATRGTDGLAVAAAYGHHRTADGRGYPRTCEEFDQSLVTRLVKICDVYEALTAVRPYKPAMSPSRAFRVMLDMAGHFDADLLRHFVRTVGIHPAGTRVRLDDGSLARVLSQTGDLHRPVVEVVERGGEPVAVGDRRPLDLSVPSGTGPALVTEALPRAGAPVLAEAVGG
jgi:putative nucleotidyltransferase with HDIG domain